MFSILYEDNHLIIYNKPPGMLVQWDKDRIVKPLEELAKDYQREKKVKVQMRMYLLACHIESIDLRAV